MTTLRDIEHKLGRLGSEADPPSDTDPSSGIRVYFASFTERDLVCNLTFIDDTVNSVVRLKYVIEYEGSGGLQRYNRVYTQALLDATPAIKNIYDAVKILTKGDFERLTSSDGLHVKVAYYQCNFRSDHYEYTELSRLVTIKNSSPVDFDDDIGHDGIDWRRLKMYSDWVVINTPSGGTIPIVPSRDRRGRR